MLWISLKNTPGGGIVCPFPAILSEALLDLSDIHILIFLTCYFVPVYQSSLAAKATIY